MTQRAETVAASQLLDGRNISFIKPAARDVGVLFDSYLTFKSQILKIALAGFLQIWTISEMKPMLPYSVLEKLSHAHFF